MIRYWHHMGLPGTRGVAASALLLMLLLLSCHSLASEKSAAPDPGARAAAKMHELAVLEGTWISQVHFTNDDGASWQSAPKTTVVTRLGHNGKVLSEVPTDLSTPGFHMLNYLTYDQYRDVFRKAAIDDTWGLMDIYEGDISNGTLVLDNLAAGTFFPIEDNVWRGFRLTLELTRPTRRMTVEKTDDGGVTWQPAFRVDFELSTEGQPTSGG